MAHYSRALDLVTTSIRLAQKGKMSEAAKVFEAALKSKDLEKTLASIEKQQVAAFAEVKKANPTLASLFTEIAAKKPKKKLKAKGKPFGGKQAPPFKKKSKAKASEGEDGEGKGDEDDEEGGIDDMIDPVLDEMTADDLGDESLDLNDGDDLALEDLDDILDDGDGVAEMPEATASDDEKDDEEESSGDSDDDGADSEEESDAADGDGDEEEESSPAQTAKTKAPAKVKVVAGNLSALDRLRKTVKAGSKKPAK